MEPNICFYLFVFFCQCVATVSACYTGWFGTSCQYKCHCRNNNCDDNGLCLAGFVCDRGWFGPLCQYQDLASLGNTLTTDLTDGDDNTCVNLQNYSISWTISYAVTSIRVKFRTSDSVSDMRLAVKDTNSAISFTPCTNQTMSTVNNFTTDIYCSYNTTVQVVLIDFGETRSVCTVNVNGGRNVALNQSTWQSSNLTLGGVVYTSSKAVDGNTDGQFLTTKSCTHTDEAFPQGTWRVTMPYATKINRYILYNRVDCCQDRLREFTLTSYSSSNETLFNYTDPNTAAAVYTVTSKSTPNVTYVQIQSKSHVLTLCEVEIFEGCPIGWFGPSCQYKCNCINNYCDVSGGCYGGASCVSGLFGPLCQYPCNATFYGYNCKSRYSTNCKDQLCANDGGICFACIPGTKGDFCDQACDDQHYGPNCLENCSSNCEKSKCNIRTGECYTCVAGFQGTFCNVSCDSQHFGPNCAYNCSSNCEKSQCNETTGECYLCVVDFKGRFCNISCDSKHFGPNCVYNCSSNCEISECNNTTGYCNSCNAGYQEDFCNRTCDKTHYGPGCIYNCSPNCDKSECDKTDGHCSSCLVGYTGDFCSTPVQNSSNENNCYIDVRFNNCTNEYQAQSCNHSCDPGWFGSNCQYKCHCVTSCDNNGLCSPGSVCASGWFGPLCQYQDLAPLGINTKTDIIDGDDNTCVDLQNYSISWTIRYAVAMIRVKLRTSDPVSYIRLDVKDTNSAISFTPCTNQTMSAVNNFTTDIYCSYNTTVQVVLIDFGTTRSVCTVNVNGGRNIALKQPTWQSSDYGENGKVLWPSSKAVDGNSDSNVFHNSCTHTKGSTPGTWKVTFPHPLNVNRYILYNRGDCCQERLREFTLTSYSNSNENLFNYTDPNPNNNSNFYTVTSTSRPNVTNVQIKSKLDVLTLCEVEVFEGCPIGWFGPACQYKCNCTNNYCDISGGCYGGASCVSGWVGPLCQYPCNATFYGYNCTSRCSTNCKDQLCDNVGGICFACIPGTKGDFCDQVCDDYHYGPNCRQNCSSNCENSKCNNTAGECYKCVAGFQGTFCNLSCDSQHFGPNCADNCSSNCEKSECNNTTGECYTCVPGFQGTICNMSCEPHYFGPLCVYNCSPNCEKSECNKTNGECYSCEEGFNGRFCNISCDSQHFGPNCVYNCSPNCERSECNQTTGYCNSCRAGYQGDFCNNTCDNGRYGAGCISNCSHVCVRNETQVWCNKTDGECLLGCVPGFKQGDTECSRFWVAPQQNGEITEGTKLISVVVPIVVALVAASLVLASVIYYRRRKAKGSKPLELDAGNNVQTTTLEAKDGISRSKPKELDLSVSQKPVAVVNAYCNGNVDKKYIEVSNLNEFMLAHGAEYFSNEFKLIPSTQSLSMSIGLSDLNRNKNRYKNICAYDHSRVHLEINSSKNEGDYINASYIEGYNNKEKFIASQGPTDATINDFVRMLWEQKADKVVMLTNLIEEGKMKCVSYWPEEGTTTFGDIKVKLAATHVFADYTIRKLELIKKDQPTHLFTQFHFTSWPDKGVPLTPWGLVDFEQRVALEKTSKPILVHCSAGVGRTGTFIALRNVMREAEDTGRINCFQTVAKLRQDRVLMVQTAEQYEFLHKAAEVAIVCMGTTVTCTDITSRISHLEERVSGRSNLEKEFKAVLAVCSDFIKEDVTGSNVDETNVYQNNRPPEMAKNRISAILPGKIYRAVLLLESDNLSDYINAVLLSGFTKRENQILTQLPMPNTVTDFWRLVAQYNVKLVVAFQTEVSKKDESLGQYLPANMTTPLDCGPYEIHTGPVKSESLWEEQQITVRVVKKALGFLPIINETHVTHIASKSTDLNPKNLLKLLKHTRSNNVQAQGRVLYMCRNGAEYSGLACVLSLLLDRMDHDQSLTVPLVVGAIKCIRPQVIPSLNQYRYLYQVLQRYNETSSPYSNHDQLSRPSHNEYVNNDQLSRPSHNEYVNIPLELNSEENVYANSQNATRI